MGSLRYHRNIFMSHATGQWHCILIHKYISYYDDIALVIWGGPLLHMCITHHSVEYGFKICMYVKLQNTEKITNVCVFITYIHILIPRFPSRGANFGTVVRYYHPFLTGFINNVSLGSYLDKMYHQTEILQNRNRQPNQRRPELSDDIRTNTSWRKKNNHSLKGQRKCFIVW